jgi:uncharacterized protein
LDAPSRTGTLDTVLIKVASRCNIDCAYCYVYHMGDDHWSRLEKLIAPATLEALATQLAIVAAQQVHPFSIVLHGGEPLLLGAARLDALLHTLRTHLGTTIPISLQTNGILITADILDICAQHRCSIAVSIDGPESVHDKYRVTHQGGGTFAAVLRGIDLLSTHPEADFLYTGLLAVIDPTSDPAAVYRFFKTLVPPSVDFILRDGNHTRLPAGKASFASTEYGTWMAALLTTYLADPSPLPIRILDDMLKSLLGGVVSKEGLGLTDFGILIVDTDGTLTKNDTLKSAFPGADRFTEPVRIQDVSLPEFLASDAFAAYRQQQRPSCKTCLQCPELQVCGGGMTLHRWQDDTGFDNPSVYCHDQQVLIRAMRDVLTRYQLPHAQL